MFKNNMEENSKRRGMCCKKKKAVVRLKDLYTNKEINYMNYSRGYVFKRKLPGRKEFHLRQVTTNA